MNRNYDGSKSFQSVLVVPVEVTAASDILASYQRGIRNGVIKE